MIKNILNILFYCFIYFGIFMLSFQSYALIKSTIRRNDMQSIQSLIYICKETPEVCNRAGKVWHHGI